MNPNPNITDDQRAEFLRKLNENVRGKNGLLLPHWEKDFLGSFIGPAHLNWFSDGRRRATDRMWARFGGEINWPHPLDEAGPVTRASDQASPDGCEFWLRADGLAGLPARRCNETAEFIGRRGLRYCRMHADEVIKNMKREGKSIELRPFKAGLANQ